MNLFYASAETLLRKAGYRVRFLSHRDQGAKYERYCVVDSGNIVTAFHSGSLSAVGLNMYLQHHFPVLFQHSAMFAIDGGVGGTFEAGRLSEEFPLAVDETREPGFQRDSQVCTRFLDVSKKDFSKFDYSKFVDEVLPWTMGIKVEKMPTEVRGRSVEYPLPSDLFYLVVEKQHDDTVEYLRESGFFVFNVGELCVVSNWAGAAFGLPPNPIVMKNNILDMNKSAGSSTRLEASSVLDEAESVCSSGFDRFKTAKPKNLVVKTPAKKTPIDFDALVSYMNENLTKFLEKPSFSNYVRYFTPKDKVKTFMTEATKREIVRKGPKRKSMIPSVRARCDATDLTWENFFEVVLDVCGGEEVSALYTFANLRAGIKEVDGLPTFSN